MHFSDIFLLFRLGRIKWAKNSNQSLGNPPATGANERRISWQLTHPSTGSIRLPLKSWNNADAKISPRCCQGTKKRKVIEKPNVGFGPSMQWQGWWARLVSAVCSGHLRCISASSHNTRSTSSTTISRLSQEECHMWTF